ncbi:MAG TPA: helix-turn-helix domain-containing protein, partial [Gemmataceae bacterium]|nr:helix-turn-helix domain-containing protein [Gemmataceae bacterium]
LRLLLTRVLQHTNGNQLQAAKVLGITRGSLRTKLRELGISIARSVASSATVEEPRSETENDGGVSTPTR